MEKRYLCGASFPRFAYRLGNARQDIKIGIPAAIQTAITCFSNVFVQSYINVFGADCMSGWTAYSKIDQFVLLPMQSLAIACTTFVGQNLGLRDVKRAKKGVNYAFGMALLSTFVIMLPLVIFAPGMVSFFNSKDTVVVYGTAFLRYILPFYLLCCVNQIYTGALRGAGNSRMPMFIMLFSFVVFRQIYLYIMSHYIVNQPIPIALGYPAGWRFAAFSRFSIISVPTLPRTALWKPPARLLSWPYRKRNNRGRVRRNLCAD